MRRTGAQKSTGSSNSPSQQITLDGEILAFYMPKEGINERNFPIALCQIEGFDSPLPLRWGEPTELINIIGKPEVGTKVDIVMDQDSSPYSSRVHRQFNPGYGDKDSDKDARSGMSYITSSTFKIGASIPKTISKPFKQFGVPGSSVSVLATDKEVAMKGGTHYRILSSSEFGNIITGPLSISSSFSKIRVGGLWELNPLLQSTIPSTIVTPISVFTFSPPKGGIKGIAKIIKFAKELLF